MAKATFGWFVQLSARDDAVAETLIEDNQSFIDGLGDAFDTLWFSDHLQYGEHAVLECWTALTTFATRYPQFNVGSLVLAQSFRNPGLLAKMMATLQNFSGGRLIAGIGAGWKEDEYLAFGYPCPPTVTRIEQLEETVQILKRLWTEDEVDFPGKHYVLKGAICEPKPDPIPPILIGGTGETYTLRVVAKHADWMNATFPDHDSYKHKLQVLKNHCQDVGRDYEAIKKTLHAYVLISEGDDVPESRGGRHIISGPPGQVRDEFARFIDAGAEHFMIRFLDFPKRTSLDPFLEQVLPRL